jgi:hypothetical protein
VLVLAIVLCSALTAGCARSAPGHGGRSALGQTASGVTGEYIPATIAQVADGADFQQTISTLQKELFEGCIRGYGFGPKAQAYAFGNLNLIPFQAVAGYTLYQDASVGLVSLRSIARSGMLAPIYFSASRPDSTGISAAEQRAIQADQWHCWSRSVQPVRRLDQQGYALRRQWTAQQVHLLNSKPVRAATKVFGSCVAHQGAPRTASESLGQFIGWLQGMINRAEFASRSGGPQLAAQPRRAQDAHWSGVFIKCGGPLVALLQRLLPAVQQSFVQEHYGQVISLEKTATQTVTTLEQLAESEYSH